MYIEDTRDALEKNPLVQGGLEVQCEVTWSSVWGGFNFSVSWLEVRCEVAITLIKSVVNHLLLARYESLLKEIYIESKDEKIGCTFLSLAQHAKAEPRPRQLKPQRQKKKEANSRDIRDMFRNPTKKATNDKKVIAFY